MRNFKGITEMVNLKVHKSNALEFEYQLKVWKQPRLKLQINGPIIKIFTPAWIKDYQIDSFIIKNQQVIIKQLTLFKQRQKLKINTANPFIVINDSKIPITFKKNQNSPVHTSTDECILDAKLIARDEITTINNIYKALTGYYYKVFCDYVQEACLDLVISPPYLIVKNFTSLWGVCTPNKNNIKLNIKLIHFSKPVILYVIIHELVHLKFPNHQQDFWKEVEKFCPDYKKLRNMLKKSGV